MITSVSLVDLDARQLSELAVEAATEKKGLRPVVLDVGPLLGIVDAFVIVSGTNDRQIRTIVDEIEKHVKEAGGPGPLRVEGFSDAQWVLMDYGDVVIHVFSEESRSYYDLERLWKDAEQWEFPQAVGE